MDGNPELESQVDSSEDEREAKIRAKIEGMKGDNPGGDEAEFRRVAEKEVDDNVEHN